MNVDPNQQEIDVALLAAISAGNEKAFTELYTHYQPLLLKFCAGYLKGDVSLAADAVDDALFDVWNKASNYKSVAKVSTWIFTIARNKTIDFLRKKREVTLSDHEDIVLEESADASPERLKNQSDEQARVKSCLDKLSDMHREMILLMYYQGLTVKEIAVITNNPANTVKTRMFHAREKVNSMLIRMGIEGYP